MILRQQLKFVSHLFLEIVSLSLIALVGAKLMYAQTVSSSPIVINEVMPAPSTGNEWVELKNVSAETVILTGWSVEDATGVLQPAPSLQNVTLLPDQLFVFELSNKLNNTGDSITLKRPDLSVADILSYTTSTSTKSWSRTTDGQFVSVIPTKMTENNIPVPSIAPSLMPNISPVATTFPSPSVLLVTSPSPTYSPLSSPITLPSPILAPSPASVPPSASVQVSEVVACPETGEPEWIEFYNPNQDDVELFNWKVKDQSGNTRSLNLTLSSERYSLYELSSAILNNDGDSVSFIDSEGETKLSIELGACIKGESTVYTSSGWQQTSTPTPEQANVFSSRLDSSPLPVTIELDSLTTTYPSPLSDSFITSGTSTEESFFTPELTLKNSFDVAAQPNEIPQYELPVFPSPQVSEAQNLVPQESPVQQGVESHYIEEQPLISKTQLTVLAVVSFACIAVGMYGCYQWYTDLYVQKDLEHL